MVIAYVDGKCLDVDRFFVTEIEKYSQTRKAKVITKQEVLSWSDFWPGLSMSVRPLPERGGRRHTCRDAH